MVSADEVREFDTLVRRGFRLFATTGLSVDDPETLLSGPTEYDPSNGEDGVRAEIDQRRSAGESRAE